MGKAEQDFLSGGEIINPGRTYSLCVDLDGTLIKSDMLWESLLRLFIEHPLKIFLLPFWILGGKAHFKFRVASLISIEVQSLPYDEIVIDYVREQKLTGRNIVLATGSNEKYAQMVADHVGMFDCVIASSPSENISGSEKQAKLVEKFGAGSYDYVGNSMPDLKVWATASKAILANARASVVRAAKKVSSDAIVLSMKNSETRAILRTMRPHQWVKNTLVFVPLVVSHGVTNVQNVQNSILAFVAFVFCASTVYILNDLHDLPSDRAHHSKKHRPIAAGELSIPSALVLAGTLLPIAILVASLVSLRFSLVLAAYFILTVFYSLFLKRKLMLDVLTLALLYTIRIIAGAIAIGVLPSFWLLAFSVFLFLSLALVKRYSELLANQTEGAHQVGGRGYRCGDDAVISQLGTSAGYLSVLVLALYVNSEAVTPLYGNPEFLWLLCPLMLYWVGLIWLLAGRGEMNEDPVVFATTDRRSYVVAALIAVSVLLAV